MSESSFSFTSRYLYLDDPKLIELDEDELEYEIPSKRFIQNLCATTQCTQIELQKRIENNEPLFTCATDDVKGIQAILLLQLWFNQHLYSYDLQLDGKEINYTVVLDQLDQLGVKPNKKYMETQSKYNAHINRLLRNERREEKSEKES